MGNRHTSRLIEGNIAVLRMPLSPESLIEALFIKLLFSKMIPTRAFPERSRKFFSLLGVSPSFQPISAAEGDRIRTEQPTKDDIDPTSANKPPLS
jgi:hypothetical protein